jgi:metal-responsive CopG/Arc/MetJ family transcriptional regulator
VNTQKVAITMPKNLVKIIDDISKINGISRSKFISKVLSEKILTEKKKDIRNAYDAIFSDDEICIEQLEISKWFATADTNDGQEW